MKCHLIIGVNFETPLDANGMHNSGMAVADLLQPYIEAALDKLFDAPIDERLRIRWRLKGEVNATELN